MRSPLCEIRQRFKVFSLAWACCAPAGMSCSTKYGIHFGITHGFSSESTLSYFPSIRNSNHFLESHVAPARSILPQPVHPMHAPLLFFTRLHRLPFASVRALLICSLLPFQY